LCARGQFARAGRDEETAAQPNKETHQARHNPPRRMTFLERAVPGFRPSEPQSEAVTSRATKTRQVDALRTPEVLQRRPRVYPRIRTVKIVLTPAYGKQIVNGLRRRIEIGAHVLAARSWRGGTSC